MIEINGEKVERGDIIVLMASPDAGSGKRPTDTYAVVSLDMNTHTGQIIQVPYLVLRELMAEEERYALGDAIRERRQLLESANAVGIFALIWKRQEYQQKLRERSPAPSKTAATGPITVTAEDMIDAICWNNAGHWSPNKHLNPGEMVYQDRIVNMKLAAERLSDLMTKRALGK